jgi:hypothetical protein
VGDVTRLVEVVVFPDEAERAAQRQVLAERATTAEVALGRAISFDQAATALAAGFTAVDWERPTEKSAANDGTFVVRDLKKHDVRVFVIKK